MPAIFRSRSEIAWERMESFAGGEDSFRRSTIIDPDQCQKLVNVIVRDNFEARTRPGADALTGGSTIDNATCRGLFYFDTPTYEQILAVFNAKLWKYEGGAWSQLTLWAPSPGPVSASSRVVFAQGVDNVLISDGVNNPMIYDGATFTDAGTGSTNAPKATILCWHAGRMFASGVSSLTDTIYVSLRLEFGIGKWNSVSRSFRVGFGDGDPIMAMASMQDFVLCVLKQNSIWLVTTDPALEPADYSTNQTSAQLSQGIGCVGRDAWCQYGNDILFMAQDGVRTVRRMIAATGQYELSAPISQPIQPYIDRINRSAWDKICAKKHQEFAFFFVPLDNSTTNNYVLVYNGRLQRWLGVWTGWNGQAVEVTRFAGANRFIFGDTAGKVNRWKDVDSLTSDDTYKDNSSGYATQLWTRGFLFGEAINNKSAYNTIIRFSAGNAVVTLTWVADNAAVRNWEANPAPTGDVLGVNSLPFLLASEVLITVKKGIRGLPAFNEAYLKLETATGWFALRNITAGAFINPLDEEQA